MWLGDSRQGRAVAVPICGWKTACGWATGVERSYYSVHKGNSSDSCQADLVGLVF